MTHHPHPIHPRPTHLPHSQEFGTSISVRICRTLQASVAMPSNNSSGGKQAASSSSSSSAASSSSAEATVRAQLTCLDIAKDLLSRFGAQMQVCVRAYHAFLSDLIVYWVSTLHHIPYPQVAFSFHRCDSSHLGRILVHLSQLTSPHPPSLCLYHRLSVSTSRSPNTSLCCGSFCCRFSTHPKSTFASARA